MSPKGPYMDPGLVVLAWARGLPRQPGSDAPSGRPNQAGFAKVGSVASASYLSASQGQTDGLDATRPPTRSAPATTGLPFRPAPWIPAEDRTPLDQEGLVNAAIVLDVIGSGLRRLTAGPSILAELVDCLAPTGALGGHDPSTLQALIEHGAGPAGAARAWLATDLARALAEVPGDATSAGQSLANSPNNVAKSLGQLALAAETLVREVRLRIESRETIDYRQA